MDDPYSILGLSRDASPKDIENKYRKLAAKYHPDTNPDADPDKFKEISKAYDFLTNKKNEPQFGNSFFNFDVFSNSRTKAQNLRAKVSITLEEAKTGCSKIIKIKRPKRCFLCSGSGAEKTEQCKNCKGSGHMQVQHGPFVMNSPCGPCHGSGKKIIEKCQECQGKGRIVSDSEDVKVDIPSGIMDGMSLQYKGKGVEGILNEISGDLIVRIEVNSHNAFKVQGTNLICESLVGYSQLVLGCTIEIPTLEGNLAEIEIPAGTSSGTHFRLKGLGMPHLNTKQVGDLLAKVELKVPKKVTKKQRKLLKQLAEIENDN